MSCVGLKALAADPTATHVLAASLTATHALATDATATHAALQDGRANPEETFEDGMLKQNMDEVRPKLC